ncbi:MAG: hypothetical protein O3C10_00315 [Chloroflexi bacterium]|nr:hypothetical protein [Chloroflexota bacterium]
MLFTALTTDGGRVTAEATSGVGIGVLGGSSEPPQARTANEAIDITAKSRVFVVTASTNFTVRVTAILLHRSQTVLRAELRHGEATASLGQ